MSLLVETAETDAQVANPAPVSRSRSATVCRLAERILAESGYAELRRVRCDLEGGRLTLDGQVSTFHLKQLAQTIAAKVPSVRDIVNRIEVPVRPA